MDFEDEEYNDFDVVGNEQCCDICGDPLHGNYEMLGSSRVCESCFANEIDLDDLED